MNFKKKRRILDLLLAVVVIVFAFGIPVWIFMYAMITGSVGGWLFLFGYVSVSNFVLGRFR